MDFPAAVTNFDHHESTYINLRQQIIETEPAVYLRIICWNNYRFQASSSRHVLRGPCSPAGRTRNQIHTHSSELSEGSINSIMHADINEESYIAQCHTEADVSCDEYAARSST